MISGDTVTGIGSSIGTSTNEQGGDNQTSDPKYRIYDEFRRQAPKLRRLSFTKRF